MYVLPPAVVAHYQEQPIIGDLIPLWLGHFPHAAGHFIDRPDGIEHALLICCTAGKGWVKTGDGLLTVHAGDYVIVPAGKGHSYGADPNSPWSIYWFHFLGTRMQNYVDLLSIDGGITLRRIASEVGLIDLFEALIRNRQGGHTREDMLEAGSLAAQIMIRIHRLLRSRGKEAIADRPIDRATRFMRENLAEAISLEDVAAASFTSASHLNRLFKENTGFPPMAYFTHLRMIEACRLLDTSEQKVAAIGSQVGYPDAYHFSRVFRRVIGQSPRAYRNP
jgi:AraC family transcriptional regulator, arabinose operon regulatory protein